MPAVGRFNGTPASMRASEEPQTVAIEDEPFELGDFRDDTQRVGKFRRSRQDRTNGAPGELAMTNLAAAGRTHAAGFADRIGREVVVEEEALLVGAFQRIHELLVFSRAERRDDKRLRLAAREQRGAVGARQHADFGNDRTNRLYVAAVDANAIVKDVPAHDLRLKIVKSFADLLLGEFGLGALREQRCVHFRLHSVDSGVALLFDGDLVSRAQLLFANLGDGRSNGGVIGRSEITGIFGGAFGKADDGVYRRLEAAMAGHDGFEHRLFGKLLGFRLDHQHGVGGASHDQIERRVLHLLDGRVELQGAIDLADARRADRTHERNA